MYRAWLPKEALEGGAVEAMIEALLDGWSRKWFAGRPMRATGRLAVQPKMAEAQGERPQWHVLEEGFAIGTSGEGRAAIAGAMLDLGRDERLASPADQAVGDLLAEACLEDLRGRVSRLLRAPPDCPWQATEALEPAMFDEAYGCGVGAGADRPAIRLAIGADLFVALIRLAVRSAPAPVLLRPLEEAVGRQPVELSAFVGAVDLPLSEVAGLASGDVLVLDSALEAPLELALDAGSRSGRCRIDRNGERLLLQVTQPYFE